MTTERSRPANASEMLALGRAFLERKELPEARLDAELLVASALGIERLQLFLSFERPVTDQEIERARELLVRRAGREPTAYILGRREFYGRPFRVGPGVLVPRPETELLVDVARERARDGALPAAPRIADFGTGSGCLAITLALEVEGARVWAFDRSARALEFARENAQALGAEVHFVEGDGLLPLEREAPFDLVVANPPYVSREGQDALAPDVLEHEPHDALFAPEGDPDFWVRALVERRARLGGRLLCELGHDQGARVRALCEERGVEPVLHRDLAGIERVLEVAG